MMKSYWSKLKESRTLWAYLVSIIVITVRVSTPKFPVDDATLAASLGLLVSFTIAEGLEGYRPSPNLLKTLLNSRKFMLVLAGIVVSLITAATPDFPFTQEQVLQAMEWVMAMVLGFGFEGAVSAKKA